MMFTTILGNLTRDAKLRYTASGSAVLNFTIASNSKRQGEEKATFRDCVLWGGRAEKLAEYLVKGKQVFVAGAVEDDKWETKDGQKRSTPKLTVSDIELISGRDTPSESEPSRAPAAAMPIAPARVDVDDDEIPF